MLKSSLPRGCTLQQQLPCALKMSGLATRIASGAAACSRVLMARQSGSMSANGWHGHRQMGFPAQHQRSLTTTRVSVEPGPAEGAPKIVILGGGFGGLYTAVKLSSLFWPKGKKPQVTLVDQSERFVFKPLLYELLNGGATEGEVAPSFQQLLAPYPIRFIQAKVDSAEPSNLVDGAGSIGGGVVQLEGGTTLEYDWLIMALGAKVDFRGVPGVDRLAVPFNTLEDALKTRDALDAVEAQAELNPAQVRDIAIVGAGYAGVELACVIAERVRNKGLTSLVRVNLITPGHTIMEGAPAGQRQAAEDVMANLGVNIITGTRVRSLQDPTTSQPLATSVRVVLDDRPTVSENLREVATDLADATASAASSVAQASSVAAESLRNSETFEQAWKAASDAAPNAVNSAADSVSSASGSSGSWEGLTNQPTANEQAPTGPRIMEADLVLWTAGSSPATKAARKGFPFPTTDRGSVQTDATLRVMSHARVFALGDVSVADQGYIQPDPSTATNNTPHHHSMTSSSFPATAQVAFQQADYVAWNVWAAMMGRPLLPFRYQHLGSMMSLGTFNGAVDLPLPIPGPLQSAVQASPVAPLLSSLGVKLSPGSGATSGVTLEGPLAALLRRAAYLYRQPTAEQQINVVSDWLSQASNVANAVMNNLQQKDGSTSRT